MRQKSVRGFTLLEVAIYGAILVFITLAIFALITMGTTSYGNGSRQNTMERSARVSLDRIAEEFRTGHPDTLVVGSAYVGKVLCPYVEFKTVTFKSVADYAAEGKTVTEGTLEYSTAIRYAMAKSIVNGNNNDASVEDDFKLVRIQNGETITLCDYVKSYTVTQSGTKITVTLVLAMMSDKNVEMTTTVTTTLTMRNRSAT